MSISSVHIRMKYVEGALNRLLGMATRRGFGIAGVEARRSHCGRRYEIALELTGDRSIENLERQFAKLYDVESVRVLPAAAPLPFRATPDWAHAVG
jgi:acetolactate synthase regulatory subunit